jgi:hypothetical protein
MRVCSDDRKATAAWKMLMAKSIQFEPAIWDRLAEFLVEVSVSKIKLHR